MYSKPEYKENYKNFVCREYACTYVWNKRVYRISEKYLGGMIST